MSTHEETTDPGLTYAGYLRLDELLSLQSPRSEEHDEMLFIIIHQTYELWFKEAMHELRGVAAALAAADVWRATHRLSRVRHILKIAVAQVDVLETLTPLEFASFRSRLATSSGFESAQFRELEALLGVRNPRLADLLPEAAARERVRAASKEPSLWDSVIAWVAASGHAVPTHLLKRDYTEQYTGDEGLQDLLLALYREGGEVASLMELLVDIDEGLQEWRYRHVKMVERTIGRKSGTGGSTGVEYLAASLHRPVFPDLWAIRSRM
ncbi:MAG: tryptophan 2,3-dioxygenase [Candidatus Limnocylindrus sp.]|jgi:tryptophan 2,3-dioxygenase